MDYGDIVSSAVPHITMLQQNFMIQFNQYLYSIVIEIMFSLMVIPFLVFSIYFTAKKVKKIDTNIDTTKQIKMNGKHNNQNKDDGISIDQNIMSLRTIKKPKKNLTPSQTQNIHILRIDRKLNYFVVFLILNVITINSFDSSQVIIAMMASQILIFIIFNLGTCALFSKYKFFRGIYILPIIGSFVPYAIGNHKIIN